eukprot:scaffold34417_cov79-Isochrysis_galbana.AAC.1
MRHPCFVCPFVQVAYSRGYFMGTQWARREKEEIFSIKVRASAVGGVRGRYVLDNPPPTPSGPSSPHPPPLQ